MYLNFECNACCPFKVLLNRYIALNFFHFLWQECSVCRLWGWITEHVFHHRLACIPQYRVRLQGLQAPHQGLPRDGHYAESISPYLVMYTYCTCNFSMSGNVHLLYMYLEFLYTLICTWMYMSLVHVLSNLFTATIFIVAFMLKSCFNLSLMYCRNVQQQSVVIRKESLKTIISGKKYIYSWSLS